MVCRWKENLARSKRLREMLKEDRISQLPDPLICHILSHLPVKDSVKTSVLSTRWTSLWLWAPCLELDSRSFPDFNALKSFGDRFFDSNRVSYINKVKLYLDEMEDVVDDDTSNLTSWIDAAVKRKIQHLDLCCHLYMYPFAIPISTYTCEARVYTCEALVSLKLHLVAVANAEFVSLPCLKTLHLKSVLYPNEATFERLVSSCPVLEELEIATHVKYNPVVFRVLSRSLKKLKITIQKFGRDYCRGVVIDAPLLSSLSINDKLSKSFVIKKMHPNAKLDISIGFGLQIFGAYINSSKKNSIRGFLREISEVRDMNISTNTVEILCGYYSKLKSLPRFGSMSRLHVTLFCTYLKWLPTFLESFPHLKSLILVCNNEYKRRRLVGMNQISYLSVPDCLLSSLEFVDLGFPIGGYDAELKLAKYFLDNSATLKKLALRLENLSIREKSNFKKELLRMPRDSSQCEVVVLDLFK